MTAVEPLARPAAAVAHPPRLPRPTAIELVDSPIADELFEVAMVAGRCPDAVAAFWQRISARGTPLVEALGDGTCAVTFLWRGSAATRGVSVVPNKVADPAEPERNRMAHVPGTDIWHLTLRMRADWMATYAFHPFDDAPTDPAAERRLPRGAGRPDPFNPRPTLPARHTGAPQSVVALPQAPHDDIWLPRPDTPRGRITEHRLPTAVIADARRTWLYRAAGTDPGQPLPLLLVLDGERWHQLGLATVLDNLVADGTVPPLAAVLLDSVDPAARWTDLTCRQEFVDLLTTRLLPWAARTAGALTDDPTRTVVAGQSLGGLTAAFAARRAPERFGLVLAQSGSFWWPTTAAGTAGEWLIDQYRDGPRLPVRFHLSVGLQEWVALPGNRRMREVLCGRGYEVVWREFNGGHDYLWWRVALAEGLAGLLGGR